MTRRPRAVLAVGHGRYADPWHPYDRVADRMSALLEADEWAVSIEPDVDVAMTRLDGAALLVVLAGDPWAHGEHSFGAPAAARAALDAALVAGTGVLAMHSAVASLRDYPSWAAAIGAVWIPGASMHPPLDQAAQVAVRPHALTAGLADFTVTDERYCRLQPVGERTVLAEHLERGEREPLIWVREHRRARVVYDALGHDERSYDSREHRELISRLARWAGRRES